MQGGARTAKWVGGVVLAVSGMAACTPERLVPDQVAMGVARLSIRHAANMVSILEADTTCGFSSAAVLDSPELSAPVGDIGTAVFTVRDCTIDLGPPKEISADCEGNRTLAGGLITVNARKIMTGRLTGNRATPVVPIAADAVKFEVSATADKFQVLATNSEASLTQHGGMIEFEVAPRLGVSASLGVCAVPTGNVTVSNVRWKDGKVTIRNGDRVFDVDVPDSNLQAQVGAWEGKENTLTGRVTVWNTTHKVPIFQDRAGLDPEYDADKWVRSFACAEDLAQPPGHACKDLTPTLVEGAGRLTVQLFGAVAGVVDTNTTCGFASPAAKAGVQLTGELGVDGATAVWNLGQGCTISVPANSILSTDCGGIQTVGGGTFTVTGTKTLRGIRSGDPDEPIVPTRREPAEIELAITFNGFRVSSSEAPAALTGESGTLRGKLRPRLARDSVLGACSIATPVVSFENLAWENGSVLLENDGMKFRLAVEASSLQAQNGTRDGKTNHLEGNMRVGGQSITVPLTGNALNPEYDEAAFMASFACLPNLDLVASDAECSLRGTIMDGAARLTVANFGALVQAVEADTRCGFSSQAVLGTYTPTGTVGERGGSVTWSISQPCTLDFATPKVIATDCNGVTTTVKGRVVVTGTKTVRGIVTGSRDTPVVPTSRDPAEIVLSASFEDFEVLMGNSTNSMRWAQGSITGAARPRLAMDTTLGACGVATPVVEFDGLRYTDARIYVVSDGKSFRVMAQDSLISAQNGNKDGRVNQLRGTLTADGEAMLVPLDQANPVLNPDYDQAEFDRGWACTPNMRIPANDAECSFHRTLAENSGRLLIQTAGTLATQINNDGWCGFANLVVQGFPDEVQGESGEMGLMRWEIDNCEVGYGDAEVFEEDCLDGDLIVEGYCRADAGRTVRGLREEIIGLIDSIVPTSRQSVEFRLADLQFENYSAYHRDRTGHIEGRLVIESAVMTSTIRPVLGEREGEAGTYDVPLPVVYGTSQVLISLDSMTGYLESQGMRFNVRLGSTSLDGFNGSFGGRTNELKGHVTVDGVRVDFADGILLNPHYEPMSFRDGYICTRDLAGPLPAQ